MKLSFGTPTLGKTPSPLPYRTPGDPPTPTTDPNDELAMPLWLDSYFRCVVETEFPDLDDPILLEPPTPDEIRAGIDWPTSAAQKRELERQGLPLARSWRSAAYLLDTYGDSPRTRRKT